jgi:hypothetical protein
MFEVVVMVEAIESLLGKDCFEDVPLLGIIRAGHQLFSSFLSLTFRLGRRLVERERVP